MKQVFAFALIGAALALLPAKAWICAGLALAAAIFTLGLWATGMIVRGFVRAAKAHFDTK